MSRSSSTWCGRRLILGTAWLIRRVRRRTRAEATSSQRPYLVVLALVAAVSFALSLVITYVVPAVAFFSLPTRAWQLAVGGLVALTAGQWRRLSPRAAAITGWAGLALILLACIWFTPTTPYPGTAALLPTAGRGAGDRRRLCHTLAGLRALPGHVADARDRPHLLLVVSVALAGAGARPGVAGPPAGAGRPARRGPAVRRAGRGSPCVSSKTRCASRPDPQLRPGAVSALGARRHRDRGLCGPGAAESGAHPGRARRAGYAADLHRSAVPRRARDIDAYDAAVQHAFAQVQAAVAASADLKAVPSNLDPAACRRWQPSKTHYAFNGCLRTPFEGGQPECAMGDTASTTTVALIGDSHAAMWTPAFQQIADPAALAAGNDGQGGLPIAWTCRSPTPSVAWLNTFNTASNGALEIIARLQAEHPRLVVVSVWRGYGTDESLTGFTAYDPAWIDSLTRLVQQLRGTGAQVLVLGPIPDPHSVVPICLSGHLDDATACSPPRSTAVNESGIAAEAAATKAGGGQYADLTDLFCTAERCPVIVGNTLVYLDVSHLTLEYSRLLAPAIGALADRALAHG